MAQKQSSDISPESRRKAIEADVASFLAKGNKIEQVPSGLSSQDPQGRSSRQIRLGATKDADKPDNTKKS